MFPSKVQITTQFWLCIGIFLLCWLRQILNRLGLLSQRLCDMR
jgi:hypothetical protein